MPAFFSLSARGFISTVLVAGGGVTPADGEVPATATVTVTLKYLVLSCHTRFIRT
jgi:hypothetical protein